MLRRLIRPLGLKIPATDYVTYANNLTVPQFPNLQNKNNGIQLMGSVVRFNELI